MEHEEANGGLGSRKGKEERREDGFVEGGPGVQLRESNDQNFSLATVRVGWL